MNKTWQIAERKYDDVVDQLLCNRGISVSGKGGTEQFLKPDFDRDSPDPFLLAGMEKAVKRIKKAIENKEIVGVFADYDADGTPAAALLYRGLSKIGSQVEVYIPTRDEGYGLNSKGIEYLSDRKCKVIITADLGIRNINEAHYCCQRGIDLIITDHHLPGESLPEAYCIINPKLPDCTYPFHDLCGCGLSYKLMQGLSKYYTELNESFLKWNLDLVAISTISDVVPLVGENRVLAKFGLKVLQKTRNVGLSALIDAAGISREKIDPYAVGFQIGPRINTPGRIDHATRAFELLTCEDKKKANKLAEWLNIKNSERQRQMDQVVEESIYQVEKQNLDQNKVIIVSGKWSKGVLGPPASRLVEKFNRPAIILAESDDEYCGSARSVEGVHILELLDKVAKHLTRYGGHRGAAGLTVEKRKFNNFVDALVKIANKNIIDEQLVKKIKVDLIIQPEELTISLWRNICQLEPFGLGNSRPVFVMKSIEIQEPRYVGSNGQHLQAKICSQSERFKSIFFNCDPVSVGIKSNTLYDIVFSINLDSWNGQENLSLNLIDVKEQT